MTIDEQKHRAHVLSVQAGERLDAGRVDEARALLREAAELDATYAIRAEHAGERDERAVRPVATIRRLLIPWLQSQGFATADGNWSEGKFLTRGPSQSILIGRQKSGHALAMLASRTRPDGTVESFDFHQLDFRSGRIAYTTQTELEAACARWREILERHVLPWLEA